MTAALWTRYTANDGAHHWGRNEHFVPNALGQTVRFDVQPYRRGVGKIVAISVRTADLDEFSPEHGRIRITRELFDVEIEVESGSENGGFMCGVPISPAKDISGKIERITMRYGELHRAAFKGEIYVKALCG